jgi:hypothetical protein
MVGYHAPVAAFATCSKAQRQRDWATAGARAVGSAGLGVVFTQDAQEAASQKSHLSRGRYRGRRTRDADTRFTHAIAAPSRNTYS